MYTLGGKLRWMFAIIGSLLIISGDAQTSSTVVVTKDSIGVGENISATVRIKKPAGQQIRGIDIRGLFNPENPSNPFASQDSAKAQEPADFDILSLGDWENHYEQTFIADDQLSWSPDPSKQFLLAENTIEMIFWDPGVYLLEGVNFIPLDSNNRLNILQLQPTILQVAPPAIFMDTTQTQLELRPLKNVIYEEKNWKDYLIYLGVLALLLLGGLFYFLFQRHNKTDEVEIIEDVYIPPSHILATQKLNELKGKELWQQGKIKEYQTQLTYIIREYLENRYDIGALEMTTDEIIRSLRKKSFDIKYEGELKNILTMADLIKFAKASPNENIHSQFMDTAYQFVNDTKLEILETDEEE